MGGAVLLLAYCAPLTDGGYVTNNSSAGVIPPSQEDSHTGDMSQGDAAQADTVEDEENEDSDTEDHLPSGPVPEGGPEPITRELWE